MTWQEELRDAVSSFEDEELSGYAFARGISGEATTRFRQLVPRSYLRLVDKGDVHDPIARMAFASDEELLAGGMRDPIGDLDRKAASRLTHRYRDRALLHVTNLCPMYCRFGIPWMLLEARSHYSPRSKNPVFEAAGRKFASSRKSGLQAQKQRARHFEAEPLPRIEVVLDPTDWSDCLSQLGKKTFAAVSWHPRTAYVNQTDISFRLAQFQNPKAPFYLNLGLGQLTSQTAHSPGKGKPACRHRTILQMGLALFFHP